MAAYVDFSYYGSTFLGTAIASATFSRLALKASAMIDRLTFARAAPVITANTDTATIDAIKMATCAVAEVLQDDEGVGNVGKITSERLGNYSVTTAGLTTEQKVRRAASLYLWNTQLMFPGLDVNSDANEYRDYFL